MLYTTSIIILWNTLWCGWDSSVDYKTTALTNKSLLISTNYVSVQSISEPNTYLELIFRRVLYLFICRNSSTPPFRFTSRKPTCPDPLEFNSRSWLSFLFKRFIWFQKDAPMQPTWFEHRHRRFGSSFLRIIIVSRTSAHSLAINRKFPRHWEQYYVRQQ